MNILITGPRKLTPNQHDIAYSRLWELFQNNSDLHCHVGDANGIDAITRKLFAPAKLTVYRAETREPWQLQARSKRMVDSSPQNAILYAFPNKNCPKDITASSWKGSGTWGTIFYAHKKGFKVELNWLIDDYEVPGFLQQLSLF